MGGKKKGKKIVYKPFDENNVPSHSAKTDAKGKKHNESISTEKDTTPSNVVHTSGSSVNSNSTLGSESINRSVELSFNKDESVDSTINRTDVHNDPDCHGSTTSFNEIRPEESPHVDKSHNNERDSKRNHRNIHESYPKSQESNRGSMRKDDTRNYRNRRVDNDNRFKADHDLPHAQRDSNTNVHATEKDSEQKDDSWHDPADSNIQSSLPQDKVWNESRKKIYNQYGERGGSSYNYRGNSRWKGSEKPNFKTGQTNRNYREDYNKDKTYQTRNFVGKSGGRSDRHKVFTERSHMQEEKKESYEDDWGDSVDTKNAEVREQAVRENDGQTENYTQDFSRINAENVDDGWTKQSHSEKLNKHHNANVHERDSYSQQQTYDSRRNITDNTTHRSLSKDKKRNESGRRNYNEHREKDGNSYNSQRNRDGRRKGNEKSDFVTGQTNRDYINDKTSETRNFASKSDDRSERHKTFPEPTPLQEQPGNFNVSDEKQQSHGVDWNDLADKDRAEITEQAAQESGWGDENYAQDFSRNNTENVDDGWAQQSNSGNWDEWGNNTGENVQTTCVDSGNWNITSSTDVSNKPTHIRTTNYQDDTYDHWNNKNNRSFPMQSHNKNTSKRYSEGTNSQNVKEKSKSWREKDASWTDYDRHSEKIDAEYKEFLDEERRKLTVQYIRVKEIQGDLFEMPKEYSLGHCVAEDMRMGSGIAVSFKREFKDIDILLNQRQKQGGLAVLADENQAGVRYVYYLVTKRESTGKPTYEKFWSSLQKMRNHIRENGVKKLAIPRLGCGLDRLEWSRVKHMIEFLLKDVEVEVTVCNFQQTEDSPEKPLNNTCKLVHVQKCIADIEEETIILYLSTEDGYVSKEMEELSKKFNFLNDFKRARKQLGEAIKYQVPNKYYILYGCIVRKTIDDHFDFVSFRKCLTHLNNNNKKEPYVYVGIQAVMSNNDELLMEKIITVLRNYLRKVDVYVCWDGELARLMPLSHRDS